MYQLSYFLNMSIRCIFSYIFFLMGQCFFPTVLVLYSLYAVALSPFLLYAVMMYNFSTLRSPVVLYVL
jgi:hypothetical protein